MSPTRTLARPMLAALFVTSGIDVLRNPGPRVAKAEPVAPDLAAKVGLPQDTELLVRINAATHVVAGSLLAIGKFRRLSALALMASLVPTTYAGHRFWETDDQQERSQQQAHFLKNLAVMGGLLLEVVDTEGRPSVGWRTQRAARRAAAAATAAATAARPVARTAEVATKGAAAVKTAGVVQDAASARLAKNATEAIGKARGATAVADRAAELAKQAAKAEVVVGTAGKAKKLAEKAAKAEIVAGTAGRARNLAVEAAKADLVTDTAAKARDLAEAAAKLKVSKEVAQKAVGVANTTTGRAVAATAAARRLAS